MNMETLLTGKKYVPSLETDLRKTFERVREEMNLQQSASKEADEAIERMGHE